MKSLWGGLSLVVVAALVSGCHDAKSDAPAVLITVAGGQVPTLAPGQQITLSAATAGITSPVFAWTISGTAATAVGSSNQTDFTIAASSSLTTSMTFSVTVVCTGKDDKGKDVSVNASVEINERPGFHPMADDYMTDEDTLLSVAAPGIGSNDTDGDGTDLVFNIIAKPTHGTLTLGDHGAFTYQAAKNYNGKDSFSYGVSTPDGAVGQATATITVVPVNDPPNALDHMNHTDEDTVLMVAAPGVLEGATDVDGDTLHALLKDDALHGHVVLADNGSFSYAPAANYNGPDSFTFVAIDGNGGTSATQVYSLVVQPVNDPPVAVNDAYMIAEDTVLTVATAQGVLANDTDVEGSTLSVTVTSSPTHGNLVLNTVTGSFTYTPAANYFGPDSFSYKANDGTDLSTAAATVTITVTPVTDAPIGVNDSYVVQQDGALNKPAPGVLGNDNDPDLNPLTAVLVTPPTHGTLMLNADGSFLYTPTAAYSGTDSFVYEPADLHGDGNATTVTIKVNAPPLAVADGYAPAEDTLFTIVAPGVLGNDSDANGDPITAILVNNVQHGTLALNADGSFQYSAAANYNGPDSFVYKVNDGTVDGNFVTVTLNVTPVDDAPVAHNDAYSTAMDTPLIVALPGVLANDTDIEGDALTAILVTGPLHGSLLINGDGAFQYTPNVGYTGADSFTYKANDGTLDSNVVTVSLTIN